MAIQRPSLLVLVALTVLVEIILNAVVIYHKYESLDLVYYLAASLTNVVCSLSVLVILFSLLLQKSLEAELEVVYQMWRQEQKQYEISKETIDLINVKCHDMKHQIRAISRQAAIDPAALAEMESVISIYGTIIKTGSQALEPDKRVISFSVRAERAFLSINSHNYYGGEVRIERGLPVSDQAKTGYHGFGVKSMALIVDKYGGTGSSAIGSGEGRVAAPADGLSAAYLQVNAALEERYVQALGAGADLDTNGQIAVCRPAGEPSGGQALYEFAPCVYQGTQDTCAGTVGIVFIGRQSGVLYPFGYGLSYTSFHQTLRSFQRLGDELWLTVRVSNTGTRYAGKDVVQIYFSAPYTELDRALGVEKPAAVLACFGKTGLLAPGAWEDVQVCFCVEDMASYCSAPATGADSGLVLADLRGKSYDDPMWSDLLDQLSFSDEEELRLALFACAYQTGAVDAIGKPVSLERDGPQGLTFPDQSGKNWIDGVCGYPACPVLAAAWNLELAYAFGEMVGQEALLCGINGWYAPGLNLHRSPFNGRCSEYFSEDPLLAGMLGASVLSGAGDAGLSCAVKHLGPMDTEAHRNPHTTVWLTEQALREIYLRPFELALKHGEKTVAYLDAAGSQTQRTMRAGCFIMAGDCAIGSEWTAANYALLTQVVRGEWGFQGFILSDIHLNGNGAQLDKMLRAGCDALLTTSYGTKLLPTDTHSPTAQHLLRRSIQNISYVLANSNLMQGAAPGSRIHYAPAPWLVWLTVADVLIGLAVAAMAVFLAVYSRREEIQP